MTFRLKLNNRPYIVLSFDPGLKSFAYTTTKNGVVSSCGFIKNTVEKNTDQYRMKFENELLKLLRIIKPHLVSAERFTIRGFLSSMAETVGVMVGIIHSRCRDINAKYETIVAAGWKKSIKKIVDLKELYKSAKKQYKLPPHVIDAMLMNRYVTNNFKFYLKDKAWIKRNLPLLVDNKVG